MLPVGVAVDVVHVALGVLAERAEHDGPGDQGAAAEVFLDVGSHAIEVRLLGLGQKHHAVEDTLLAFVFLEQGDALVLQGFTTGKSDLPAGAEFDVGKNEWSRIAAECHAGAGVTLIGCGDETQ